MSDEPRVPRSKEKVDGVTRRQVLAGAAGATLAGLADPAHAQYSGIMEGGLEVPFRLPLGALNYLDRNEYIHNMEIISYIEGPQIWSGEPLMSMWARGEQRRIAASRGWLDVTDPRNPEYTDVGIGQGTVAYQESTGK